MAKTVDKIAQWGAIYCGCQFADHWKGTWQDPTWERNSKDSGKIKVQYNVYHAYQCVRWITPGQPTYLQAIIEDWTSGKTNGSNTFHDCGGGDAMGITATGTGELIQTDSNPYGTLHYDIRMSWGWNDNKFTFYEDLGYYPATYELDDDFKISKPQTMTGSISFADPRKINCSCSIDKWSKNKNIKGTPYTDGGGRNWNFRAQIKVNGTVVYEITQNTGETKSADFEFTDLTKLKDVPLDTDVVMHFTCSNNYQQTEDFDVTFRLQGIGYVVKQGSTKKIRYIEIWEDRGNTIVHSYNSGRPRRIP